MHLRLFLAALALVLLSVMPAQSQEGWAANQRSLSGHWYLQQPFAAKPTRASKGYRKHVRKIKAAQRQIAQPIPQMHERLWRSVKAQIVAHPLGCPSRLFCGCGVSVKVFGRPVRDLYLAANWRRFPPASPGPGKVAWRRGHVFYIMQDYGDGTVLAYDPNSGRHQTRVHRRSLAGFRVVDPRAGRLAQL